MAAAGAAKAPDLGHTAVVELRVELRLLQAADKGYASGMSAVDVHNMRPLLLPGHPVVMVKARKATQAIYSRRSPVAWIWPAQPPCWVHLQLQDIHKHGTYTKKWQVAHSTHSTLILMDWTFSANSVGLGPLYKRGCTNGESHTPFTTSLQTHLRLS